jgi:beta-phosphoglucomutase-like phosphatase (HAD superfamily)
LTELSLKRGPEYDAGQGNPIPGALEFLEALIGQGYQIVIFSCTASAPAGSARIERWLLDNLYPHDVSGIEVTVTKPHAFAYLDNRAVRFEGLYPSMEQIKKLSLT